MDALSDAQRGSVLKLLAQIRTHWVMSAPEWERVLDALHTVERHLDAADATELTGSLTKLSLLEPLLISPDLPPERELPATQDVIVVTQRVEERLTPHPRTPDGDPA
ncbi:hypothetical protein [Streptomyces sp. NPDC056049]|uniref:hypothetical protein n=1 Tax=Streptomyces sp. NPDC056049 TaxID=3345693 RepID=UPI0035DA2536